MGAFGFGAVAQFVNHTFFGRPSTILHGDDGRTLLLQNQAGTLIKADGTRLRCKPTTDRIELALGDRFVSRGVEYVRSDTAGHVPEQPATFSRFGAKKSDTTKISLPPNKIVPRGATFKEGALEALQDSHTYTAGAAVMASGMIVDVSAEKYGYWSGKRRQKKLDAQAGGASPVGSSEPPETPRHPGAALIASSPTLSAISQNPILNLPLG